MNCYFSRLNKDYHKVLAKDISSDVNEAYLLCMASKPNQIFNVNKAYISLSIFLKIFVAPNHGGRIHIFCCES